MKNLLSTIETSGRTDIVPVGRIEEAAKLYTSLMQRAVEFNTYNNANDEAAERFSKRYRTDLLDVLTTDPLMDRVALGEFTLADYSDDELVKFQKTMSNIAEDIIDGNTQERRKYEENMSAIETEMEKRELKVA